MACQFLALMYFSKSPEGGGVVIVMYSNALSRLSFRVLGTTCDGLSANRRLFKLHDPTSEIVYKVCNPYAADERSLYFFSDPPHLMKMVRNAWASDKRHLWVCT